MTKVVAGMDLHSSNVVIGIMDMDGKRLASGKVPCELKEVVVTGQIKTGQLRAESIRPLNLRKLRSPC